MKFVVSQPVAVRLLVASVTGWLLVATALAAEGPGSWLGGNLTAAGDFEEEPLPGKPPLPGCRVGILDPQKTGASASRDDSFAVSGTHSLKLSLPVSGASINFFINPLPVEPGEQYITAVAVRQEGFNREEPGADRYAGVGASANVLWLDEKRRRIGGYPLHRFIYGNTSLAMRDAIVRAPAGAAYVEFQLGFFNDSLAQTGESLSASIWLDAVQLRRYHPPPTPEWATGPAPMFVDGVIDNSPLRVLFVGSDTSWRGRGGTWSRIVPDPDSERGTALNVIPADRDGLAAHSPYYDLIPPGIYRLRARIKVTDVTGDEPIGSVNVQTGDVGSRLVMQVVPRDFARADTYQILEADLIMRGGNFWYITVGTTGKRPWTIDSIRLFPLMEVHDAELLDILPGLVPRVDPVLRPPRSGPIRVLCVAGIGWDTYRIVDVCRLTGRDTDLQMAWLKQSRGHQVVDLPETAAEWFDYRLVILANVPHRALTLAQKAILREFVRRGGCLVLTGGQNGFGRGGWDDSLLAEALPVSWPAGTHGTLVRSDRGEPLTLAEPLPWAEPYDLGAAPRVYYHHRVTARPGATVLARAGGDPLLVAGDYGEGRVLCITAAPFGDPPRGQTAFWAWSDWIYLFRDSLWWLLKR